MVVKRKHIKDFLMYDNAGNHININKYIKSWQTVPGQETGQEAWVSSAVNMNDLSTGLPYSIENTSGLFHLCVLDEADSKVKDGGASFAYFSSYNSFALMGPEETCMGSQVSLQASVGLMNYKWFSSHTGNQVLSNTNTLLVEESGNYWVEAEVQFGGCKVVDSLNVNFLFPEIELGSDTTVCEGDALTYSVDDSFSSYLWNNGDTDHETNWQMDMNGQFLIDVTVTDNMGCVNSDTVRVQVNDTPDIVLNTNEVCKGGVVSNTTSFEHYEWVFNGAVLNVDKTQNWIEPTQSGVYSLTAWTNNGCQVTEDIVLTVNPLPSFVLNDQFACDGETFTVDAPLGFALYNWSTGESTQSIVLNADTDYWLELTDTNGCVAREEASLRYRQPVLLDLGPDQNECVGASIRLTNSADYTNFSWTFKPESDPAVSVPLNPVRANEYYLASGIQANSGTYIVEATDVNGCNVQDEIRIFFSDTDPINLRITENLCAGQTIDIIATEGYDSYTWYENNVHVPAYDNMVQISGVNTDALFRVEATSVVCVKSSEIEVVEHLLPTVNLPDVFSICDGEEEELFVDNFNSPTGASFSYLYWNDVDSVRYSDWNSARVLVNGAGNYNVTAVDEFGCMAMDNVTVSAFAISVFDLGPPISACDNENVLLTNPIVGAQSYNWYQTTPTGENLLVSDNALSVNQSGTFVLKVVDANGCNSNDQVTVNVNSAPDFSLGPDQVECGQIDLAIDPQADFAQYQWNDNPALNSNQLHVTQTGLYKLEVWNTFGCRSEDVVDITLVEAPEIMLSDTAVCAGEEVQLVGPSGSYSYLWNTGEDTQAILAKNGHYELKVTDPNGCFATSEVNVVWRSVPQVNLGPDVIVCPIDEWFLDAGAGFTSYSWHNGSEEQGVIANLMDTVNIVHVTDQFGCTGFDSQTVKHKVAEPLELISDTSICNSDVLIASVDPSFVMYEWSTGHIQPDIEIRQEGQYWLKAFDGCVWAADTMQVVVHPTPVIAHLDTSIYAQVVVLPEGGTAPYSYAVNGNDYQESNLFANLSNGKYVFEVEDVNGCLAMNEMALDNVLDIDISPILTPNGDGYNDTWGIKGIDKMPNSIIRIFDRYGKQLAEYKASEPAWDGMYLGRPVPSDAYWYIIQLMPLNRTLKGYITIKR